MEKRISNLLENKYKLRLQSVSRLDAYEDINMRLQLIDHEDLLLKLTFYTKESQLRHFELQHRMMGYLRDHGMPVPDVITTSPGGKKWTMCRLPDPGDGDGDVDFVCQVLSYLPGETMHTAGNPVYLLEDVGRLAGQMNSLLQKFSANCIPERRETLWELSRAPALEPLLEKYCPDHVQELGHVVLQHYRDKVEPKLPLSQKGYIHNDINNLNLIVHKDGSQSESQYQLTGLIDFGDVIYSYYVYDIAVAMGDLMAMSLATGDPLSVARKILHGYRMQFNLLQDELECLKAVICVRLLQVYVLRHQPNALGPDNEYRNLKNEEYLQMCKCLTELDDQVFMNKVITCT